ncbi:hypothetical protein JKF63_01717 [Porcisia hertigi]|uniref:Uncharacterized protein n=1 Tax=Porcisia hertigi TaxID=2761500 RepID=A0A836IET3_9TRYP|nr:hypothetical protein JKF63_01717 [Porcisia hertigi]
MDPTPHPEKDVNQRVVVRKRSRSLAAVDSSDSPLRSFSHNPPPMPPVAADATSSEAAAARWSVVQQRFAAAQWRRGCFHLPPQAPSAPPGSSRPHLPVPAKTSDEMSVTAPGAAQSRAATAARYIPPHPWKILQSAKGNSTERTTSLPMVKGALVQSAVLLPAFLAPPAMVELERWNTYWEVYSTCCADELESLAKQLEEPSATAGYRRVLLTLSATTAPGAQDQPPALVEDPCFAASGSSREGRKDAVPSTNYRLSPLSSASLSHSRSPPQPSAPHSCEESASSSSWSYSSSYSSYVSSYTSDSRSSSSAGSATSAALAEDGTAALSVLLSVLDDLVYHYTHRFGAVEHLETRDSSGSGGVLSTTTTTTARVIVSVQFTTAEAAGLFLRWADGLSLADLIVDYRRDTQPTPTPMEGEPSPVATAKPSAFLDDRGGGGAVWWSALEDTAQRHQFCLIAKLAPHDPRHLTAKLLLGPNVMVSTPLVKSLFAGLFDATQMEYRPELRAFSIEFASKRECRLALHALQCSLWRVFGASLVFT